MHVGDSSLDMTTVALSSDGECEQSSQVTGSVDERNVEGIFQDTSTHESFEVHKQSLYLGDDHDDIPLCVDFKREQWVSLDVLILNEVGVPVVDGICRNFDPRECVDANPLGLHDVGVCIMISMLPLEVPLTWRFFLRRWPFRRVLHDGVSLWVMGGAMSERRPICWPDRVLAKASVNMILTVRPEGIKSFDEIAY